MAQTIKHSLTKAQKRVWFNSQAATDVHPNVVITHKLKGTLNVAKLELALTSIVRTHEILNSRIQASSDKLERIVAEPTDIKLDLYDLTHSNIMHSAHMLINELVNIKLNPTIEPLFRFSLIKESLKTHYLVMVFHPIILDKSSTRDFVDAISEQYNQATQSSNKNKTNGFDEIVELENNYRKSEKSKTALNHWLHTLKTNKFIFNLPTTGFAKQSFVEKNRFDFSLSAIESKQIRQFAKQNSTELFTIFMAVYMALLSRYSSQSDILVNHSCKVTYKPELQHTIGCLENKLPLRAIVNPNDSLTELVSKLSEQIAVDYYYHECPITDVVRAVRNKYRHDFDGIYSNVALERSQFPYRNLKLNGITSEPLVNYTEKLLKEDVVIYFDETESNITLEIEFAKKIANQAAINFASHFKNFLKALIKQPNTAIIELNFLSANELKQIIHTWNPEPHTKDTASLNKLFEQQVKSSPNKTAIICPNSSLSYQELNARANQLANFILQQQLNNKFIAFCCPEGPLSYIAMLAIHKSDCTYVPLDSSYPASRINYILTDTKASLIITTSDIIKQQTVFAKQTNLILLDKEHDLIQTQCKQFNTSGNKNPIAYVIYTSGSTGNPKGVLVPETGIVRLVTNNNYTQITTNDVIAQAANIAFDAATFEVWGAFLNGATLCSTPKDTLLDADKFADFLANNQISILWLTVALFNQFAFNKPAMFKKLTYLLVGGDALTPEMIYRVLNCPAGKPKNILNGYGPTENTTFTTTFNITKQLPPGRSIPIGQAISNTSCYVLNKNLKPCPIGIAGELYTGGMGVAHGYLNKPDLTNKVFIVDPFSSNKNAKLYKTGDLVRWLDNGNIEYIGRADNQVKIRGFRIELGEIEASIQQHRSIAHASVQVLQNSNQENVLIAYYVQEPSKKINEKDLRNYLRKHLPSYMLPTYIFMLSEIPITANGKVNKKALPNPFTDNNTGTLQHNLQLEQKLSNIWTAILKIPADRIEIDSDFFELGGHSLLATQLVSRINSELKIDVSIRQIFERRTIREICKLLKQLKQADSQKFDQYIANQDKPIPLSFAQTRLWFFYKSTPQSAFYNISFEIQFTPKLQFETLQQALQLLVNKHNSFKTYFVEKDAVPYQIVAKDLTVELARFTWDNLADKKAYISKQSQVIFNLANAGLFNFHLLENPKQNTNSLLFNIHHIIFDGWSLEIFMTELETYYSSIANKITLTPQTESFRYVDFAVSQRQWQEHNAFAEQNDYWQTTLAGELPTLAIPTDFPRPNTVTTNGASFSFKIAATTAKNLEKLALEHRTSLFAILLTIYNILLHKYSGQEDLIVASPIANRNHSFLEDTIGFFVNTTAYRHKFTGETQVKNLITQVHDSILAATDNQDLPFDLLLQQLRLTRDPQRTPLAQTIFALQNGFNLTGKWRATKNRFHIKEIATKTAKFEISLILNQLADGTLKATLEYNTDLYKATSMQRFATHFTNLITSFVEKSTQSVAETNMLSNKEYQQLIYDYNQTKAPIALQTVQEIFEAKVLQHPTKLAICYNDISLSYMELNLQANQLAHYLRKQYRKLTGKQIVKDTFIGLALSNNCQMIVATLAILKAGAAYVPLEPNFPKERINWFVEDCQLQIIISDNNQLTKISYLQSSCNFILLDDITKSLHKQPQKNPENINKPIDIAYIIYTSGSTGKPKGVMTPHLGIVRLTKNINYIKITPNDNFAQAASIAFDAATIEIWGALLNGASVFGIDKHDVLDPAKLASFLQAKQISTMWLTVGLFNQLASINPNIFTTLKYLLVGGDALNPKIIHKVLNCKTPPKNLINGYGPTENTTFTTTFNITKKAAKAKAISIGKPISNTTCYILDKDLNPTPIGVIGELYTGGMGLARGYLNRAASSFEKFIANPFSNDPNSKIYKTGDLVRWLDDGNIEFIGRTDFQVKIRGFRIEIGEVENKITAHKKVKQAIVIVQSKAGQKRLIAYFTTDSGLSETELHGYLNSKLPDYMQPSLLIKLNSMPINNSGKIDRKALPSPTYKPNTPKQTESYSHTERELIKVWAEALALSPGDIALEDDFFSLGGHSILTIKLLNLIEDAFACRLKVIDIFKYRTLKQQAEFITTNSTKTKKLPIINCKAKYKTKLAPTQQNLWFLYQQDPTSAVYNMPFELHFSANLDISKLKQALITIVQKHQILNSKVSQTNAKTYIEFKKTALNITTLDFDSTEKQQDYIKALANTAIDIEKAVVNYYLLSVNHTTSLFLNIHHIAFDGWSLEILLNELNKAYSALVTGKPMPKKILNNYLDFAVSQNHWQKNNLLATQKNYWQEVLQGELPILNLPYDHPKNQANNKTGAIISHLATVNTHNALKDLAKLQSTNLFAVLLSIYHVFLSYYSDQEDVIIGIPSSGRSLTEFSQTLGFFVNTIVNRQNITGQQSFTQLLRNVQDSMLLALDNQDIPFEELVRSLQIERNPQTNPIFQTMFVFEADDISNTYWQESNINCELVIQNAKISKFDLSLIIKVLKSGELSINFEYNTELFKASSIDNMAANFLYLIENVIKQHTGKIAELNVLAPQQLNLLTHEFNQTDVKFNAKTIHEYFEEQVNKTPNNPAICYQNTLLSYLELNQKANQLAHLLRTTIDCKADKFVGICLSRSENMIIACLATLKAGMAYVPLDPSYPQERLEWFITDTKMPLVLTDSLTLQKVNFLKHKSQMLLLDKVDISKQSSSNPTNINSPTDLAYVIYTSGSTGKPKGVMVQHIGVPNLSFAQRDNFAIQTNSKCLQFASMNFDAATSEIYNALLNGACLYILPEELRRSPDYIAEFIQTKQITHVELPPAVLELMPKISLNSLETIVLGGDVCALDTLNYWSQNRKLVNAYGPTEATVCATICANDQSISRCDIGLSINNSKTYVLNRYLKPAPLNAAGELYISGVGLARGYLNRPDLTTKAFINSELGRIYKTGDLVKRLTNGHIEFLGRTDFQIKIRGFRVEIGEIERQISKHPNINQVIVVALTNNDQKQLAAYYSTTKSIDNNELRSFVAQELPDYMLPTYFTELKAIPLNPNGKIDRKALPKPKINISKSIVKPKNQTETNLLPIWQQFFDCKNISTTDNFFHLGGSSLTAVKLLNKINDELKLEVKLMQFLAAPNIENLSNLINNKNNTPQIPSEALDDSKFSCNILTANNISKAKNILLTGANGFLGVYLLEELLKQTDANIYCLIRAKDLTTATTKLQASIDKLSASKFKLNKRVQIILGDLQLKQLGITDSKWQALATTIDVIYHNGAMVHHVYDYVALRDANVGSTIELLKFANLTTAKSIHYISTGSAASQFDTDGAILEAGPGATPPSNLGYILTKWVAEKILWQAFAKGQNGSIYRPGNITGESTTGICAPDKNHALLLLKSCIQLGIAPNWPQTIEMTPVDVLAKSIVSLARHNIFNQQAYNLAAPQTLDWQDYISYLQDSGVKLKLIDTKTWCETISQVESDNALFSLKGFYADAKAFDAKPPITKTQEVQRKLHNIGIENNTDYVKLAKVYLDFLVKNNFIIPVNQ